MKRFVLLISFLLCFCAFAPGCRAAELSDIFSGQLEQSGADELRRHLPEETREYLEEAQIEIAPGQTPSLGGVGEAVAGMAAEAGSDALSTLAVMLGIVILAAVAECIADMAGKTMGKSVSVITASAVCLAAASPAAQLISEAGSAIEVCCGFDAVFIPVYSAICAAAGKAATAAQYSAVMLAVLEGAALLINQIALPALRVILAISLTSSLSPTLPLSGIIALFEKNLKWLLGFVSVTVVAVMGLGTAVTSAMDELTAKTARFVVSSAVPVLGGAMGDALSSVTGCVALLRTSVGGFGLAAMAFILLPPLIKAAVWSVCMGLCAFAADMLGVKSVKTAADCIGRVLSVVIALIVFTAALTVFTLASLQTN